MDTRERDTQAVGTYKPLPSIWVKSALLILTAVLPATAGATPQKSKAVSVDETAEIARVRHAKELLGRYFRLSKVENTVDQNNGEIQAFVHEWVGQALAQKDRGRWKKFIPKLANAILTESQRYGFDPILLIAVIESESSFSPMAQGNAGEIGLMQIMPTTGKWISKRFQLKWDGRRSLYDPIVNVRIGAAYLAYLRAEFDFHGNHYLAAYNMGSSKVRRALASQTTPKIYASRVKERYLRVYAEFSKK